MTTLKPIKSLLAEVLANKKLLKLLSKLKVKARN
jgi:hypothetical protein